MQKYCLDLNLCSIILFNITIHNGRVDLAEKKRVVVLASYFFIQMVFGFAHEMKRIRNTFRNISLLTLKYPSRLNGRHVVTLCVSITILS
jgi:hypothetical protein